MELGEFSHWVRLFCRLLPLNVSLLVCVHVCTITVLMSKTVARSSVGNDLWFFFFFFCHLPKRRKQQSQLLWMFFEFWLFILQIYHTAQRKLCWFLKTINVKELFLRVCVCHHQCNLWARSHSHLLWIRSPHEEGKFTFLSPAALRSEPWSPNAKQP